MSLPFPSVQFNENNQKMAHYNFKLSKEIINSLDYSHLEDVKFALIMYKYYHFILHMEFTYNSYEEDERQTLERLHDEEFNGDKNAYARHWMTLANRVFPLSSLTGEKSPSWKLYITETIQHEKTDKTFENPVVEKIIDGVKRFIDPDFDVSDSEVDDDGNHPIDPPLNMEPQQKTRVIQMDKGIRKTMTKMGLDLKNLTQDQLAMFGLYDICASKEIYHQSRGDGGDVYKRHVTFVSAQIIQKTE